MGSVQSESFNLCGPKSQTQEKLAVLKKIILTGRQNMEETSERATEEGFFSPDGPTCSRCLQNRAKKKNHSLHISLREYLVKSVEPDRATEERPHKITIRKPPSECKHRASLISSCSSDRLLLLLFFSLCGINPPSYHQGGWRYLVTITYSPVCTSKDREMAGPQSNIFSLEDSIDFSVDVIAVWRWWTERAGAKKNNTSGTRLLFLWRPLGLMVCTNAE